MPNVVLWWHAMERALLFVAYNVSACQLRHLAVWDVAHWPFAWAWWASIPYGGILAMERAQTPLGAQARGALALEHLILGGTVAVLLLALAVRLFRWRARTAWLREPIVREQSVLAGGAHWATAAELARYRTAQTPLALGQPLSLVDDAWRSRPGWLALSWTLLSQSVLDIAPSGAGKSVHLAGCLLRLAAVKRGRRDDRFSFFLWDVKGELAALLAPHLRSIGYVVTILHPFERRQRVNPVVWLDSARACDLFWEAWLANSDSGIGSKQAEEAHEDWSRQVLVGMTLALRRRHGPGCAPSGCTLPLIFAALQRPEREVYALLQEAPDGGAAASQWQNLMAKGGTAFANQRNSLVMRGDLFKDDEPRWFVSGHDLDLEGLFGCHGSPPHAVFFQIPTAMQGLVMPLTAAVTAVLFARVQEVAHGGRLPRRLICLFDEAGSGATIPKLYDHLNTLRGAGVAQWIVVQYLDQLEHKYGKKGAVGIKVGCGTWIGRAGLRPEDAEELSARLGAQRLQTRTWERVIDERGTRGLVERGCDVTMVPLLSGDLIRRLPPWCLLVAPRDTWPFVTYHPPYYADAALMKRAGREEGVQEDAAQGGHVAVEDARTDAAVAVPAGRPGRTDGPTASPREVTQEQPAVVVRRREPVQFKQ